MNDAFLSRYNSELQYFYESAGAFAGQYGKVAERLRLDAQTVEDPHVKRLIQAFAFLTARIRLKLEDEFPEVCEALLHSLYPHYLAPVPPVMMVQLKNERAGSEERPQGVVIPRGSRIETDRIQGEPCRFRTCYDTQIFPIAVDSVKYLEAPFPVPEYPYSNSVASIVQVSLRCESEKVMLNGLMVERLRWFLGGASSNASQLYENILRDCVGIGIGAGNQWQFFSPESLSTVGFSPHESLLPHSDRQLSAYRILSEFFAFPEKFRYLELNLKEQWTHIPTGKTVEIVFYLSRSVESLRKGTDRQSMQLHCTPVINLFTQRAEAIRLNDLTSEYRIVPNAHLPRAMEVYSVERVAARTAQGDARTYVPFYSSSHGESEQAALQGNDGYWYSTRRPATPSPGETDRGSDVFICLVDVRGKRAAFSDWTLDVDVVCSNRDLVARLPVGDKLNLKLVDGDGLFKVLSIVPQTPTLRRVDKEGLHWRLVSILSLNHLSLTDPQGAASLREILRLHNPSDSPETQGIVESIRKIQFSRDRAIARVQGGPASGFCRGLDIDIWIDGTKLIGTGAYLFATVLEHFFGMFASINSFTRLNAHLDGSSTVLLKGKPRVGHLPLL